MSNLLTTRLLGPQQIKRNNQGFKKITFIIDIVKWLIGYLEVINKILTAVTFHNLKYDIKFIT